MEKNVVILELKELLLDKNLEKQILPFFNTFDNGGLDDDIQKFLKKYALDYERLEISRTTLVFNEDRTELLGYFTLGLNTLYFSKTVKSIAKFKKIESAYPGIDLFKNGSRPVYKLFMIGKNFKTKSNNDGFMDYCFNDLIWERICICNSFVGSNLMYLDCENNEMLINAYNKQGFEIFDKYTYTDENNETVEMVKMIAKV